MRLGALVSEKDCVVDITGEKGLLESEINDIVYDSRKAAENTLFFCMRGAKTDGHDYADMAYKNGCRAFVCEHKLPVSEDAVQITVKDSREALADFSAEFFGNPAKKLKLIGVTGTKGKSTVASFIHHILNKNGVRCGMIGTIGTYINGIRTPTANTTPESRELHKIFADMLSAGEEYVVMEVSSQAYLTGRVRGLIFEAAVFTNLSPDHIGPVEHKDFIDYMSCKARLFSNCRHAVVNADDSYSSAMIAGAECQIEAYGLKENYSQEIVASLRSESVLLADNIIRWKHGDAMGIGFDYNYNGIRYTTALPLPGVFNIYNALAAAAVCRNIGIPHAMISAELENVSVPGRFELVRALPYATFIIDYAHNGISLKSVLSEIKEYSPKRLVCLFGTVGGRTELRRAELGKVAAELADFCIITSDNPDFEDPEAIAEEVARAADKVDTGCGYVIITDRAEAIRYAVKNARDGDVVLFAGKGHEDYQLIRGKKEKFSEREIITEAAEKLKETGALEDTKINL